MDSASFYSENFDRVEIWRVQPVPLKGVAKVTRVIKESLLSFNAWRAIIRGVKKDTFGGIVYCSPFQSYAHVGVLSLSDKVVCNV
jgi:hypothetical protein|tara:strand:+ start:1370 stop:1624 length:255 start_codon:yes stop_codon:yes gene_type:complete